MNRVRNHLREIVRTLGALVFALAVLPSIAGDRDSKVRELMQAQGLVQMFEDQLASGKEEGRKQAAQMTEQMLGGLNPPPAFRERFRKASEEFVRSLEAPWSARDIVAQWAKAYASEFSDQELDQLIGYYTSPLGRKDVAVSQRAFPIVSAHFAERYAPIQQAATARYIADLKRIVDDCKCHK